MKILVLGSQGMAGHMIAHYLERNGFEVYRAARKNESLFIEVSVRESIDEVINSDSYDYVINCIGMLAGISSKNPEKAALVNGWLPHYLELLLSEKSTRLIHLSSDCVFNGQRGNYIESDVCDEMNFYGRSKSMGEVRNNKDITFRTSIIGPELNPDGVGLLKWVLTHPDKKVPGWANAKWNGVTTLQLAKCLAKYMLDPKISGVYHLVSNQHKITKYELLCLINEIYELNKEIVLTYVPKNIDKVLVDTRQEFDFEIPDYPSQLTELKDYKF